MVYAPFCDLQIMRARSSISAALEPFPEKLPPSWRQLRRPAHRAIWRGLLRLHLQQPGEVGGKLFAIHRVGRRAGLRNTGGGVTPGAALGSENLHSPGWIT